MKKLSRNNSDSCPFVFSFQILLLSSVVAHRPSVSHISLFLLAHYPPWFLPHCAIQNLVLITNFFLSRLDFPSGKKKMASESNVSENSSLFESLFRFRELSVFLPFILGFSTNSSSRQDNQDPNEETENSENSNNTHGARERVILINPFTQGMVVIDGTSSLETLFQEIGMKSGHPPASKESIEAIPSVEIGEGEGGGECVICLEEWEVGGVAKEMPCKHKFHQNCIEKWLGIHGSCPVCRYQMPVAEKEAGKRDEEEEQEEAEGGERRRVGREIWVSFNVRSQNSNQAPYDNSSDASSSPRRDSEVEN